MNKNDMPFLFKEKRWNEIVNSYSTKEIANTLSFKEGLILAYLLLYNDKWDESLQNFSIKLLNEIRKIHSHLWNESWEFDALLGSAYNITRSYDERYEAYKRAFIKAKDPPPGLLIALARCCICPGTPPISYDEGIDLALKSIKDIPYQDGIGLLSHIYSLKEDKENEIHWSQILKDSDQSLRSPSIDPAFLIEAYLDE